MTVEATTALTPTAEVTVSVWLSPSSLPEREMFVVSHGSWQNRWKISLTPEARPRWSVRTTTGIVDLDAPVSISADRFTHLAATYDGARLVLYVDGMQVSERPHTGAILPTTIPLLLGQMLPNQSEYNFPGVLDDVRVYNRALTSAEVEDLYAGTVANEEAADGASGLGLPFPNPAPSRVTVPLALARSGDVLVTVVDALGRIVATLHDGPLASGVHAMQWDAGAVAAGVYVVRLSGDAGTASRRVLVVR